MTGGRYQPTSKPRTFYELSQAPVRVPFPRDLATLLLQPSRVHDSLLPPASSATPPSSSSGAFDASASLAGNAAAAAATPSAPAFAHAPAPPHQQSSGHSPFQQAAPSPSSYWRLWLTLAHSAAAPKLHLSTLLEYLSRSGRNLASGQGPSPGHAPPPPPEAASRRGFPSHAATTTTTTAATAATTGRTIPVSSTYTTNAAMSSNNSSRSDTNTSNNNGGSSNSSSSSTGGVRQLPAHMEVNARVWRDVDYGELRRVQRIANAAAAAAASAARTAAAAASRSGSRLTHGGMTGSGVGSGSSSGGARPGAGVHVQGGEQRQGEQGQQQQGQPQQQAGSDPDPVLPLPRMTGITVSCELWPPEAGRLYRVARVWVVDNDTCRKKCLRPLGFEPEYPAAAAEPAAAREGPTGRSGAGRGLQDKGVTAVAATVGGALARGAGGTGSGGSAKGSGGSVTGCGCGALGAASMAAASTATAVRHGGWQRQGRVAGSGAAGVSLGCAVPHVYGKEPVPYSDESGEGTGADVETEGEGEGNGEVEEEDGMVVCHGPPWEVGSSLDVVVQLVPRRRAWARAWAQLAPERRAMYGAVWGVHVDGRGGRAEGAPGPLLLRDPDVRVGVEVVFRKAEVAWLLLRFLTHVLDVVCVSPVRLLLGWLWVWVGWLVAAVAAAWEGMRARREGGRGLTGRGATGADGGAGAGE